jgi:hypothetical protein
LAGTVASRIVGAVFMFAVLFGLIVLLAIFDEPPPASDGAALSILLEALFPRDFGLPGFELFDNALVSLWPVATLGLRRSFTSGLPRIAISHDLLR